MSLPDPVSRRHLHTRTIRCEGFERDDGFYDIEAQIIDTKAYDTDEPYRGLRKAGAHVHDMQVRLTLDRGMTVRGIEVTTNHAPYDVCPSVAPGYQALIGAKIGGGWRKAVTEAVGRTRGCTHITELLMPMATVAFQTMGSWKSGPDVVSEPASSEPGQKPYFIDACKAWAADGPVVQRLFPMHYRARD
ncbi:MAG: DUF2889 domain-containing protein [Pseudomonadota bacterium]